MQRPEATTAEISGLPAFIVSHWINVFRLQQVNLFKYTNVMVQRVDVEENAINLPVSILGNISTGVGYPTFAAIIMTIRTAFFGRRGRGRVYFGGLKLDGSNSNVVEVNYLTAWQTNANTVLTNFSGGSSPTGWQLGVRGRAADDTFHSATNLAMRTTFGVQRRRNTGVGI
jgi:hypothetical protein